MERAPALVALQTLFDVYDSYPLECDGMTRLLHARLAALGIAHTMHVGRVENQGTGAAFSPHFFIELQTQQGEAIIDYRARRLLGILSAHGVFLRTDAPHMVYQGEVVDEAPLSEASIAAMLSPIPEELQQKLLRMNQRHT